MDRVLGPLEMQIDGAAREVQARLDLALAAACSRMGDEVAAANHRQRAKAVYREFDIPETHQALRLLE